MANEDRSVPGTMTKAWGLVKGFRGVLALAAVLALWAAYPPRVNTGAAVWPWQLDQLRTILLESSVTGLLAVGMTLVIIGGGIDLSVGSALGMSGICFALATLHWRWEMWQAAGLALGAGVAAGLLNGLWVVNLRWGLALGAAGLGAPILVVKGGWPVAPAVAVSLAGAGALYLFHRRFRLAGAMQPFAATLAMMVIARGAAKWFSRGSKVQSAEVPAFYDWLSIGPVPGLIYVFLAAVLLAWGLLRWTAAGRHLYAIGGNPEAARLSGIRVRTVLAATYVLSGLTAAMAGIGQVSRLLIGDPEEGAGYELDAIAAVVLGGTNLMGGRGGVLLTLLGVMIMGFLSKYLSLHNLGTEWRLIAKGAIIVVAVATQRQGK